MAIERASNISVQYKGHNMLSLEIDYFLDLLISEVGKG